jgi:4-amino-4-deoxy-L-arabinose transferase-like glycosyltransferase
MCHPLGKDWHAHLRNAITIIRGFDIHSFLINPVQVYHKVIMSDPDYPPLYYVLSAAIRHFFGLHFMCMTSTIFFVILVYSTYKIGTLIKNETHGLLSAGLVAFYPIMYMASRDFNLELAQAAMVSAALYALLRSEKFMDRKYSILFGFILAIGMLIKQQVFLFVLGPFFVVLFSVLKEAKGQRARWGNIGVSFLLFSAISFLFFYHKYMDIYQIKHLIFRTSLTSELAISPENWFNAGHAAFYFIALKKYQIGLLNLIFFLCCLPAFCRQGRFRGFFAAWIVVPIAVLTFLPAKYNEYTISCLPALALITSWGIVSLRNSAGKILLISALFLCNICLFLNLVAAGRIYHFSENKNANVFLDHFKVNYTKVSTYEFHYPYIYKTVNQYYRTIGVLKELLPDKKSKVGVIGYIIWPGFMPSTELEILLSLYTPYRIKNLIFDPLDEGLDTFDLVLCVTSESGKAEQWVDQDIFIKQIKDFYNHQRYYHLYKGATFLPPYWVMAYQNQLKEAVGYYPEFNSRRSYYHLYKGVPFLPPHRVIVYQNQLKETMRYYPTLELIHKSKGVAGRWGDILIYGMGKYKTLSQPLKLHKEALIQPKAV